MATIEVDRLTKRYGDLLANDDLSFAVESGEIFGYLGPNGAGKTTTIRTLMGFQAPTAGTARLLGADIREAGAMARTREDIGFLPANPTFDEDVTGRTVLDLHRRVKGDAALEAVLERFEPPLDRPIREYSSGNVQKLGIVQAFMHDPTLVILDEPTSGLDPLMQRTFNEYVRELAANGTTVFFSSHVLSEVRTICDRVGVLRDGVLVTIEDIHSLLDRSGKRVRLRAVGAVAPAAFPAGTHDLAVDPLEEDGPADTEATFTYTGPVGALVDSLGEIDLVDLTVEEAPLEEVFMRFYGEETDA